MPTIPSRDRTEIIDEIRRYAQERLTPEQQRLFQTVRRAVLRARRPRGPRGPARARPVRRRDVAPDPRTRPAAGRTRGEGLLPGLRGARLRFTAHRRRHRDRRHAVRRRLGDDGGHPARPRTAPHRAPRRPGPSRRGADRRHPRPARSDVRDDGRVLRPPGGRPADRRRGAGRTGRRPPPRPRRRACRGRGLVGDAGAGAGRRRHRGRPRRRPSTRRTGRRRPPCCGGSPTTTSRSSATASTSWAPTTAGTRCAPSRGRGWGCCATAGAARSRTASRSCRRRCGRRRASRGCSTSPRRTRGRPSTSPTTSTTSASSR